MKSLENRIHGQKRWERRPSDMLLWRSKANETCTHSQLRTYCNQLHITPETSTGREKVFLGAASTHWTEVSLLYSRFEFTQHHRQCCFLTGKELQNNNWKRKQQLYSKWETGQDCDQAAKSGLYLTRELLQSLQHLRTNEAILKKNSHNTSQFKSIYKSYRYLIEVDMVHKTGSIIMLATGLTTRSKQKSWEKPTKK